MASFNKVILAGNMTREPQLSFTPGNTPVCEFGIATNRRYRDREGNQKEEVCYVDLVAYGKTAENINQYMNKGRPLLVEGRLRFRQWTNKEGQNRSKLDVFVENFSFIDSRGGGGQGGDRGRATVSAGVSGDGPAPADDEPPPENPDIPF